MIEEDGRDDSFTADGKLDGFQCTPAEAAAILHVVNTSSLSTLTNDVQLSTKAADNIVAYRLGDDETAGTADDETFGSLAELDAVPYVGPAAFQKLLDYVHDAELVGSGPAPAGQWSITTIANGSEANFALTSDGDPVVVFNDGAWRVKLADGTIVAMPDDTSSSYGRSPEVAVDETGVVHIMYRQASPSNTPTVFKHASLRNGQWIEHDSITSSELWLDQSPGGTMFALVKAYDCSNCTAPLTLYAVAPDGSKTAEPLWSVSNDTKLGLSVGNDGYPAIVYGGARHARRGPAGWRTFDVSPDGLNVDSLATTGGDNATVFVAGYGLQTFRQNGSAFDELLHLPFIAYTGHIDAASDALGIGHACFARNNNIVHVRADAAGNVHEEVLGIGDERCWLGTDAAGTLHLFFTIGNVINHGTYQ